MKAQVWRNHLLDFAELLLCTVFQGSGRLWKFDMCSPVLSRASVCFPVGSTEGFNTTVSDYNGGWNVIITIRNDVQNYKEDILLLFSLSMKDETDLSSFRQPLWLCFPYTERDKITFPSQGFKERVTLLPVPLHKHCCFSSKLDHGSFASFLLFFFFLMVSFYSFDFLTHNGYACRS